MRRRGHEGDHLVEGAREQSHAIGHARPEVDPPPPSFERGAVRANPEPHPGSVVALDMTSVADSASSSSFSESAEVAAPPAEDAAVVVPAASSAVAAKVARLGVPATAAYAASAASAANAIAASFILAVVQKPAPAAATAAAAHASALPNGLFREVWWIKADGVIAIPIGTVHHHA